jgi:hypothetical protein
VLFTLTLVPILLLLFPTNQQRRLVLECLCLQVLNLDLLLNEHLDGVQLVSPLPNPALSALRLFDRTHGLLHRLLGRLLLSAESLLLQLHANQLPPLLHFLVVVPNPVSGQLFHLLTPFDLPNQTQLLHSPHILASARIRKVLDLLPLHPQLLDLLVQLVVVPVSQRQRQLLGHKRFSNYLGLLLWALVYRLEEFRLWRV